MCVGDASASMGVVNVLHLVGSSTSQCYFDDSIMHGRSSAEWEGLDRKNFHHQYAVLYNDGKLAFPSKLDDASIECGRKIALTIGVAMDKIAAMQPAVDVVVPHLYGVEGKVCYRALCDMLGIEMLGYSPKVCAVGRDKFHTKAICVAAGVPCPKGHFLHKDMHGTDVGAAAKEILESQKGWFVVKPARAENSTCSSLIKNGKVADLAATLTLYFQNDDRIIVEEYIAGRKARVAVLEVGEANNKRLVVLPKLEYFVNEIRDAKDKLGTDANSAKVLEKESQECGPVCPAQFTCEEHQRIDDLALKAHKALGCKDYSIYDIRVDKDGFPFMLGSRLFCSFSPDSVIVTMAGKTAEAELQPHSTVFESLLRRIARETRSRRRVQSKELLQTSGVCVKKRKLA